MHGLIKCNHLIELKPLFVNKSSFNPLGDGKSECMSNLTSKSHIKRRILFNRENGNQNF